MLGKRDGRRRVVGLGSDCLGSEEEGSDAVWPEVTQHSLRAAARPARPGIMDRQGVRRRPRADTEWNWEEAGQSAWGRQLLGDDSSDEDESEIRCGRFAESGRWMSELYGYPRHLMPTSGEECSG